MPAIVVKGLTWERLPTDVQLVQFKSIPPELAPPSPLIRQNHFRLILQNCILAELATTHKTIETHLIIYVSLHHKRNRLNLRSQFHSTWGCHQKGCVEGQQRLQSTSSWLGLGHVQRARELPRNRRLEHASPTMTRHPHSSSSKPNSCSP